MEYDDYLQQLSCGGTPGITLRDFIFQTSSKRGHRKSTYAVKPLFFDPLSLCTHLYAFTLPPLPYAPSITEYLPPFPHSPPSPRLL